MPFGENKQLRFFLAKHACEQFIRRCFHDPKKSPPDVPETFDVSTLLSVSNYQLKPKFNDSSFPQLLSELLSKTSRAYFADSHEDFCAAVSAARDKLSTQFPTYNLHTKLDGILHDMSLPSVSEISCYQSALSPKDKPPQKGLEHTAKERGSEIKRSILQIPSAVGKKYEFIHQQKGDDEHGQMYTDQLSQFDQSIQEWFGEQLLYAVSPPFLQEILKEIGPLKSSSGVTLSCQLASMMSGALARISFDEKKIHAYTPVYLSDMDHGDMKFHILDIETLIFPKLNDQGCVVKNAATKLFETQQYYRIHYRDDSTLPDDLKGHNETIKEIIDRHFEGHSTQDNSNVSAAIVVAHDKIPLSQPDDEILAWMQAVEILPKEHREYFIKFYPASVNARLYYMAEHRYSDDFDISAIMLASALLHLDGAKRPEDCPPSSEPCDEIMGFSKTYLSGNPLSFDAIKKIHFICRSGIANQYFGSWSELLGQVSSATAEIELSYGGSSSSDSTEEQLDKLYTDVSRNGISFSNSQGNGCLRDISESQLQDEIARFANQHSLNYQGLLKVLVENSIIGANASVNLSNSNCLLASVDECDPIHVAFKDGQLVISGYFELAVSENRAGLQVKTDKFIRGHESITFTVNPTTHEIQPDLVTLQVLSDYVEGTCPILKDNLLSPSYTGHDHEIIYKRLLLDPQLKHIVSARTAMLNYLRDARGIKFDPMRSAVEQYTKLSASNKAQEKIKRAFMILAICELFGNLEIKYILSSDIDNAHKAISAILEKNNDDTSWYQGNRFNQFMMDQRFEKASQTAFDPDWTYAASERLQSSFAQMFLTLSNATLECSQDVGPTAKRPIRDYIDRVLPRKADSLSSLEADTDLLQLNKNFIEKNDASELEAVFEQFIPVYVNSDRRLQLAAIHYAERLRVIHYERIKAQKTFRQQLENCSIRQTSYRAAEADIKYNYLNRGGKPWTYEQNVIDKMLACEADKAWSQVTSAVKVSSSDDDQTEISDVVLKAKIQFAKNQAYKIKVAMQGYLENGHKISEKSFCPEKVKHNNKKVDRAYLVIALCNGLLDQESLSLTDAEQVMAGIGEILKHNNEHTAFYQGNRFAEYLEPDLQMFEAAPSFDGLPEFANNKIPGNLSSCALAHAIIQADDVTSVTDSVGPSDSVELSDPQKILAFCISDSDYAWGSLRKAQKSLGTNQWMLGFLGGSSSVPPDCVKLKHIIRQIDVVKGLIKPDFVEAYAVRDSELKRVYSAHKALCYEALQDLAVSLYKQLLVALDPESFNSESILSIIKKFDEIAPILDRCVAIDKGMSSQLESLAKGFKPVCRDSFDDARARVKGLGSKLSNEKFAKTIPSGMNPRQSSRLFKQRDPESHQCYDFIRRVIDKSINVNVGYMLTLFNSEVGKEVDLDTVAAVNVIEYLKKVQGYLSKLSEQNIVPLFKEDDLSYKSTLRKIISVFKSNLLAQSEKLKKLSNVKASEIDAIKSRIGNISGILNENLCCHTNFTSCLLALPSSSSLDVSDPKALANGVVNTMSQSELQLFLNTVYALSPANALSLRRGSESDDGSLGSATDSLGSATDSGCDNSHSSGSPEKAGMFSKRDRSGGGVLAAGAQPPHARESNC